MNIWLILKPVPVMTCKSSTQTCCPCDSHWWEVSRLVQYTGGMAATDTLPGYTPCMSFWNQSSHEAAMHNFTEDESHATAIQQVWGSEQGEMLLAAIPCIVTQQMADRPVMPLPPPWEPRVACTCTHAQRGLMHEQRSNVARCCYACQWI